MRASWPVKLAFWTATLISTAWLVLVTWATVIGIRHLLEAGSRPREWGIPEILVVSALALHPLLVLWLIVRAVRHCNNGKASVVIVRALLPLTTIILLFGYVKALDYLNTRSAERMLYRWHRGSITYNCSPDSPGADYDPSTIGMTSLRLIEHRKLGTLGTWVVVWPGKAPITAKSFPARTGSIGGSQGIHWQEEDGRTVTAYLSFSDVMNEYGTTTIWVKVVAAHEALKNFDLRDTIAPTFFCGPVPGSYRPSSE